MLALRELWQFRSLILNLTQRELKGRYRKSLLGWVWSLLNPASTLAIYTIVFGYFFKAQLPKDPRDHLNSFTLYLFTGLVLWNFFSGVVNGAMGSLLNAGPLLKKIYFPAEAPVIANAITTLFQTAIEAAILIVVMVIVGNDSWTFLLLPIIIALLMLFAIGIGLLVGLANVYFRDVNYLIGIVLSLLFYATPVIYPITLVPIRIWGWLPARAIITANPLTQFVYSARDLMYRRQLPTLTRFSYIVVASFASFALGLYVFHFRRHEISEEV